MALFTICATDHERLARPCAVVEAVSAADAMQQAEQLRRTAEIGFVPAVAHLSARRASRREARVA